MARLPFEVGVSLSSEQVQALEVATSFFATGVSQYCRQAIAQRLMAEKFLALPPEVQQHVAANNGVAAK